MLSLLQQLCLLTFGAVPKGSVLSYQLTNSSIENGDLLRDHNVPPLPSVTFPDLSDCVQSNLSRRSHTSGRTRCGCCVDRVVMPMTLRFTVARLTTCLLTVRKTSVRAAMLSSDWRGASRNMSVTSSSVIITSQVLAFWFIWPRKQSYQLAHARANHIPLCPLKSECDMKKNGRGSIDEKTAIVDDVEISAVRWYDNKAVTLLLSTYAGFQPVTEVTRWNRKMKYHERIECPNIVTVYNKHMGGVDLIDSLIGNCLVVIFCHFQYYMAVGIH